jgi:chromosome segregation ATPase
MNTPTIEQRIEDLKGLWARIIQLARDEARYIESSLADTIVENADAFPSLLKEMERLKGQVTDLKMAHEADKSVNSALRARAEAAEAKVAEYETLISNEAKGRHGASGLCCSLRYQLEKKLTTLRADLARKESAINRTLEEFIECSDEFCPTCTPSNWKANVKQCSYCELRQELRAALSPVQSEGKEQVGIQPHFSLEDFERRLKRVHPHEVSVDVEIKTLNSLIQLAKKAQPTPPREDKEGGAA